MTVMDGAVLLLDGYSYRSQKMQRHHHYRNEKLLPSRQVLLRLDISATKLNWRPSADHNHSIFAGVPAFYKPVWGP